MVYITVKTAVRPVWLLSRALCSSLTSRKAAWSCVTRSPSTSLTVSSTSVASKRGAGAVGEDQQRGSHALSARASPEREELRRELRLRAT